MKLEHSLHLRMGSCSVEFLTDQVELWHALGHMYRAFADEDIPGVPQGLDELWDGVWRASVAGREYEFGEFPHAIERLEDVIAEELLAESQDALRLHAGVVVDERHTVFLVGHSGSGKTTLSLEFARRGMRFATDEFAIIRGNELQPFPRSATQKFEGPLPAGHNLVVPDAWGHRSHLLPDLHTTTDAIQMPPKWIVFPTHTSERSATVRGLSAAEASAELMRSTFDIEGQVQTLWPRLADFVEGARVCAFDYDDAARDLDVALQFLEATE